MRTLKFNQFEFDRWESEESLEISIITKRDWHFPDVPAFASSVWGAEAAKTLPQPITFEEHAGPGNVRDYLKKYADLTLPAPCEWATYVISNDWNDWDAILVGPDIQIHYHWWTTA